MVNTQKNKVGEAYAFFDCRASKNKIETELPYIRKAVETPNELELSLTQDANPERFKPVELREITEEARQAGLKYTLTAKLLNSTNKQTADRLADILNQVYQSPLYEDKEPFYGDVFYEEDGHYVTRE